MKLFGLELFVTRFLYKVPKIANLVLPKKRDWGTLILQKPMLMLVFVDSSR
jgi:hypothetical protein